MLNRQSACDRHKLLGFLSDFKGGEEEEDKEDSRLKPANWEHIQISPNRKQFGARRPHSLGC